jgi:hypothetical protein
MLQLAELSFDRRTAAVEIAPPLRLTGDQRIAPISLEPDRLRLTLTRGAAPLRRLAAEVGSGERPAPVLAGRYVVRVRAFCCRI